MERLSYKKQILLHHLYGGLCQLQMHVHSLNTVL